MSTHRGFRMHRDLVTHLDGSSLTAEEHAVGLIGDRDSSDGRVRLARLTAINGQGGYI